MLVGGVKLKFMSIMRQTIRANVHEIKRFEWFHFHHRKQHCSLHGYVLLIKHFDVGTT
jgi:hypothetical protein